MSRGPAGFEEYTDPRLVALYDSRDPDRRDISFYVDLAVQLPAESVVDIGCGTGLLAVELARRGHRVTGIDPSPAMLAFAKARPGAAQVRWIQGSACGLGEEQFDLAVMTGHVVQVIQDDRELLDTFATIRRVLRPGGRLAFDSRSPETVRDWADRTPQTTRRTLDGGVEVWIQDPVVRGDHVAYTRHYLFPDGREVLSRNELRYRSFAWFTHALTDMGFQVDPADHEVADFIFLATPAEPRRAVAMRLHGDPPDDWWASVLYDSADSVTVCLDGMSSLDILATMHQLGVPIELVAEEMRHFGVDWDPQEEVRVRSEADMEQWRRLDQDRRKQLKDEFLRRRNQRE